MSKTEESQSLLDVIEKYAAENAYKVTYFDDKVHTRRTQQIAFVVGEPEKTVWTQQRQITISMDPLAVPTVVHIDTPDVKVNRFNIEEAIRKAAETKTPIRETESNS